MSQIDAKSLCWVASYPKSGNTWVRFLIAGLHAGPDIQTSDMELMVPDVHLFDNLNDIVGRSPLNGTSYVKTHWLFDHNLDELDIDNSCIYILRNPLDVLASHLNYITFKDDSERLLFIKVFLKQDTVLNWLEYNFGSWSENCLPWLNGPKRRHVIIYEEILADPIREVKRLADFMALDSPESNVTEIAQAFEFQNLRKKEEQERKQEGDGLFQFFAKAHSSDLRFMNQGKAGYFSKALPAALIEGGMRFVGPRVARIEEALGRDLDCWSFLKD